MKPVPAQRKTRLRAAYEFVDKVPPRPLKEKKAPRATIQAGCFAPAANSSDFGQSFPPRPRGRPSGRVPLEPPAFFNPSNGHPCPSPGGEHPCSPKKGNTGKSALGVQVRLIKTTTRFVNSLRRGFGLRFLSLYGLFLFEYGPPAGGGRHDGREHLVDLTGLFGGEERVRVQLLDL